MNKKNILHLGLYITILFLILNCGGSDTPEPPKPPQPPAITITVAPQTTSIQPVGGEQTITVTTNATDWTVISDETWLTATKLNATSAKIAASANANSSHNTVVRFNATTGTATATATVNVSQAQLSAIQSDSLALVDLYNSTAGSAWTKKWTLTMPLRQWQGVKVENNRVIELKLFDNKLTGALPESFGNLTALQYCDLSKNSLNGAVPASINRLTQLEYLDLSENALSGNFPAISALTKLLVLDMSFNCITALPALNTLTVLEYLAFSKNSLSGSLPSNLSTKLIYLDASFNSFSGSIPSTWSSLNKLKALYLYKNSLDGNIPTYISPSTFTLLESLALDGNNLTGNIPSNLGDLPKLAELWLAQNRLNGAIPNSLLNNTHWADWKTNVCPQQSGFGFDNCPNTTSLPVNQSATISYRAKEFKAKYKI
jgi:hypothetical protein